MFHKCFAEAGSRRFEHAEWQAASSAEPGTRDPKPETETEGEPGGGGLFDRFLGDGCAQQGRNSDEVSFASSFFLIVTNLSCILRFSFLATDWTPLGCTSRISRSITIMSERASPAFSSTALICPPYTTTWFWSNKKPSRSCRWMTHLNSRFVVVTINSVITDLENYIAQLKNKSLLQEER